MVQSKPEEESMKTPEPGAQTQRSIHRLLLFLCFFHHVSVSDYLLFKKMNHAIHSLYRGVFS